ncbi:MAG: type II toxin-antitoxin system VapC family toxin [Wenzhouxiangellaceae bacterium]
MTGLVADCSAFLPLCFEDESSNVADAMIGDIASRGALVPAIWWYEIRNVLVVNERRGRIETGQSDDFLNLLGRLPIVVVLDDDATGVVDLARRYRLTVYDAAYLALARSRGLPLVTLDRKLADAARGIGVELFV